MSLLYLIKRIIQIRIIQKRIIQIYHAGASKRPIATSINSSNPSENIPLNKQQTQTGDLEYI